MSQTEEAGNAECPATPPSITGLGGGHGDSVKASGLGMAEKYLPKALAAVLLLIAASEKLQIVLLVPLVCVLSLWTGVILTWGTVCLGLAYLLLMENREHHRKFRAEYNWNCRFLAEQYHVLLSHWSHGEGPLGDAAPGQIEFFNSALASWWHSSAERTLRDSLGKKVLSALRRQLGVEHAMQQPGAASSSASSVAVFVDDFRLGAIVAGQQPPTIVMASSSRHANRTTLDLTIRYAEEAKFTVAAVLSSYQLPITVTGIQFLGTVRLELEFATSKQEKFKLRLSLLDDLQLDFQVKVGREASSFIDIAGLPGIGPWMNRAIRSAIKEKAVWPRKMTIVGDKNGEDESTGIPPALLLPEPAICAVALVAAGENVPEGYELLDKTCTGAYAANVGGSGGESKFLCFKKSNRGLPLTDLGVVRMSQYGDMPCGYRAMLSTGQGHDGAVTTVHSHAPPSAAEESKSEAAERGECGDRVYLCYEKGPTTKGYIDDVQVMFSDEFSAVRKKKILAKDQPEFAFPQGYSFVKVNRIEERKRDIFVCFRRVGATTAIATALPSFLQAQPHVHTSHSSVTSASAPVVCGGHSANASQSQERAKNSALAGVGTQVEEKKSSGLSSLKKKVISEYRDSKNNKAVKKRQALEAIGITPSLIEYLRTLCTNPDIFVSFPLDDMDSAFQLNPLQAQHAQAILDQVPALSRLRYDLTPKQMSDEIFWYTYFSLIKNRVGNLFDR